MKRIIALLLALIMCFTIVACDMGSGNNDDTNGGTTGGDTNGGSTNGDTNGGDTNGGGTNGGDTNGGNNGGNNTGNNGGATKPEKVTYNVPAEGYDGSEVTIKFSHTMGEALRNELDAAILRFNELYPNIHIEHEQVGGYDDVRDTIKTELDVNVRIKLVES